MMFTRHFMLMTVSAIMTSIAPCVAQNATERGQAAPNLTGSGSAGHVALWKNGTTLTNSVISQASGNVGIGTTAPAAKLEVNGDAQVDGNFSLSGSILLSGAGQLIWAPNDTSGNFSAGLISLPSTTTGASNTAVGIGALQLNTTASNNTAVGNAALRFNTTGGSNTATGTAALLGNTTGNGNVAYGNSALYSNTIGTGNVASGTSAMLVSTSANWNVASGNAAMYNNTTGSYNTAIGNAALFNNGTGSNNIALGSFGGNNLTGSNNIDIGNNGTATDNATIRIGSSGTHTSAFIAGIYGINTSGIPVYISSNGQLGTVSSSRRYKEDIRDMGDTSSGLMRLRPVAFRYKNSFDDGSKPIQYGLIAEEVAEVYPDLVARSADGQIETVKYQLLDPMLLNELQKQHATIASQKEQIRSLEERLVRIEAALSGTTVSAAAR